MVTGAPKETPGGAPRRHVARLARTARRREGPQGVMAAELRDGASWPALTRPAALWPTRRNARADRRARPALHPRIRRRVPRDSRAWIEAVACRRQAATGLSRSAAR